MKKTIREIARRKNLSANLPRYADGMMGRYLEFSAVRLSLNYHVFCDIRRESAGISRISDEILDGFAQVMEQLPDILDGEGLASEDPAAGKAACFAPEGFAGGAEEVSVSDDPSVENADGLSGENADVPALESVDSLIAKVESLRSAVTDRMQVITSYTDIFHLYEYVLNRVEYRFREGELPENYSDDAFCREIMKYIVRDEEPAEVNRKIGEILGQLPVRLTKQKFFELLDAGLSTYTGSDRSGLDDFLYMLRMSAMLEEPEQVDGEFAHLALAKEEFRACDYANITEEEYHRLAGRMEETADFLNETSELYTILMEQLNDVWVILKSCSAAVQAEKEVLEACKKIMRSSEEEKETAGSALEAESAKVETETDLEAENATAETESDLEAESATAKTESNLDAESVKAEVDPYTEADDATAKTGSDAAEEANEEMGSDLESASQREEMLDQLVSLEGVQERLSEELSTYGYLVDDLYDGDFEELARLGFAEIFRDLKDMESLTSSSIFVDITAKEEGEIAVDEDYIEQKKEILHRDIDSLFAANSRLVRRAVMATVISQLPVFFENLNSMQDFVYNSLTQCRDEAEKIACVEVISSILTDSAGV